MNQLSPGRIVLYKLSKEDCRRAGIRRNTRVLCLEGNQFHPGDVVPAIVVRVSSAWSESTFNGQAFLDGNDTLWLDTVQEGSGEGQWQWPVRK